MSKKLSACVLVAAVLGAAIVLRLIPGNEPIHPGAAGTLSQHDKHGTAAPSADVNYPEGLEATATATAIDAPDATQPTQKEALARYLRSKKRSDLESARELYPDDRLILMQSALSADRADSPELDRLEEEDPANSVPHLIRASLHARSGNLEGLQKEMKSALSKRKLDSNYRERWAMVFDAMDNYFTPVMSTSGDPVLRMQFLTRVRADGEVKALGWLINTMEGR